MVYHIWYVYNIHIIYYMLCTIYHVPYIIHHISYTVYHIWHVCLNGCFDMLGWCVACSSPSAFSFHHWLAENAKGKTNA